MRKVIITVVGLGLLLILPATASAAAHKSVSKRHHARSVKHAKAKSSRRSKHADNDRTLMTPKWT